MGKGAALKTGFEALHDIQSEAYLHLTGGEGLKNGSQQQNGQEVIMIINTDGQQNPADIKKLVEPFLKFEKEHGPTIAAMPAYNEAHSIADVIHGCLKHVDKVVVVDDGSSDGTAKVAVDNGAYVVRHPQNEGYGAALRTCFETARNIGADAMVVIDSDGQHDPEEMPKLLWPLCEGVYMVIGSRFCNGNGNGENVPAYRKLGMKVLDITTSIVGGINVTGSQSGYRAYGSLAIDCINIDGDDMSAGSEILLQAKDNDANGVPASQKSLL